MSHKTYIAALALSALAACAQQGPAPDSADAPDTAQLSSHHWLLSQAAGPDASPQPQWIQAGLEGKPVRLTFSADRLAVDGLCNGLGAGYTIKGRQISITPMVGTLRMCPDTALMRYERGLATRLPQATAWRIYQEADQPMLELRFNDGATWRLRGTPTDEALYGPATTLFLEVAPAQIACSHPLIPNYRCMQVRTIEYDAAGIKTRQGPWEAFYGDIQGYTHQEGLRNILRVKRYTRNNPPQDAARYVYVLDLVVESERP